MDLERIDDLWQGAAVMPLFCFADKIISFSKFEINEINIFTV